MVQTAETEAPDQQTLYERDFLAWTQAQAELLRSGRFEALDVENLIEEIECLGRERRRDMDRRLSALLSNLLKWQYQVELRSRSWSVTIEFLRRGIAEQLEENPSLEPELGKMLVPAYEDARLSAGFETGRSEYAFPDHCPYTLDQALDPDYWPA